MKRILWGLTAVLAGLCLADPVQANNCLSFDGVNDHVNCTNDSSLNMTGPVTVEAWVCLNTGGTYQSIAAKMVHEADREGYCLAIDDANRVWFGLGQNWDDWSSVTSADALTPGAWYHVAGTYDGDTMRVYINGALRGSAGYADGIQDSGTPLLIGSRESDWYLAGKIDLVRVWNVARSTEEIQTNMGLVITPGTAGLMAQYAFNEGVAGEANPSILTLDDSSGNYPAKGTSRVDGLLSGFDLAGSTSNWVVSAAPEAVEMNSFTAVGLPGKVTLNWITSSESNSANWLIERSNTTVGGYAQIGRLPASGNNANGARYSYTDATAGSGQIYFYRIAEQEQNGKLTYYGPVQASAVITASAAVRVISAWPNPFRSSIMLQCSAHSGIRVYDLTGRLVRRLDTSSGAVVWDGRNDGGLRLGPGVYFIRVNDAMGTVTRKVTKIQ